MNKKDLIPIVKSKATLVDYIIYHNDVIFYDFYRIIKFITAFKYDQSILLQFCQRHYIGGFQ